MSEPGAVTRSRTLDLFWFLVDAPMFIDAPLVERMHDAIIRPSEIILSKGELEASKREQERKYGLSAQGEASVPFVAKTALKGEFGHNVMLAQDQNVTRQYSIPRTPERLLEELVAFYLAHFDERVFTIDPAAGQVRMPNQLKVYGYDKLDEICGINGPRPLVLLDAPKGSKLMPMAGEFTDGTVDLIYDRVVDSLSADGEPLPRFTRRDTATPVERHAIWNQLIQRFDARLAMFLLEEAGRDHGGAKYEWIDFRLPWGNAYPPSPLHLHISPRAQYSMGTFAHAFVHRGESRGVRIVGSLKSGGDINVLAIYER